MRRPVSREAVLIALAAFMCGLGPGSAPAGPRMRIVSSRTYVEGYTVQDGIVLPVIGVITNSIELGSPEKKSTKRRGKIRISNRKALDRFFAQREKLKKSSREGTPPAQTPVPAKRPRRRPRSGPRITTLVGRLLRRDDGTLCLIVKRGAREIQYALEPDAPARALLEKAGADEVQAVLIGKVDPADKSPLLRVQSGWLPEKLAPSSVSPGTSPAADDTKDKKADSADSADASKPTKPPPVPESSRTQESSGTGQR